MIKITKNGRNIPLNRFADELKNDIRHAAEADIQKQVKAKLRDVTCPEHGSIRQVRVRIGRDLKAGSISAEACCDKVRQAIDGIMKDLAK